MATADIAVSDISSALTCMQFVLGVLITAGAVVLLAMGTDRHSSLVHRVLVVGLVLWGIWFAWLAWNGHHDSPPALALAAAVAVVLIRNGRQLRGILDGEAWWPKHAINSQETPWRKQ